MTLQFVPTTLTLDSGMTRPPPLLAEADLLGCMDKVHFLSICNIIFSCGNIICILSCATKIFD